MNDDTMNKFTDEEEAFMSQVLRQNDRCKKVLAELKWFHDDGHEYIKYEEVIKKFQEALEE